MKYRVYIGGQSPENAVIFEDLASAINVAFDIAEERADERGLEEEVGYYYNPGFDGHTERGVAPEGSDAAYWPKIEEVKS